MPKVAWFGAGWCWFGAGLVLVWCWFGAGLWCWFGAGLVLVLLLQFGAKQNNGPLERSCVHVRVHGAQGSSSS
jgi:hypothetical protein